MRRSVFLVIVALLLAAPSTAAAKDWRDHKGDIPFVVGFEEGMQEARFSGKPALLFFTATW